MYSAILNLLMISISLQKAGVIESGNSHSAGIDLLSTWEIGETHVY